MTTQIKPTQSSARIRQIIGAVMIAATNILWLAYHIKITLFVDYSKPVDARIIEDAVLIGAIGIIFIIGWILLLTTASNKATRIASIVALTASTLSLMSNMWLEYNYWERATDSPYNETIAIIGLVLSFFTTFIIPIMWVYLYVTIIKANEDMKTSDRGWIHVLIIAKIAAFSMNMYYMFAPMILPEVILQPQFMSWTLLAYIIVTFAEFRMAMSSAFNGERNEQPATLRTYLHLNRYPIAVAIATIFIVGAWMLISHNASFINDLTNI